MALYFAGGRMRYYLLLASLTVILLLGATPLMGATLSRDYNAPPALVEAAVKRVLEYPEISFSVNSWRGLIPSSPGVYAQALGRFVFYVHVRRDYLDIRYQIAKVYKEKTRLTFQVLPGTTHTAIAWDVARLEEDIARALLDSVAYEIQTR